MCFLNPNFADWWVPICPAASALTRLDTDASVGNSFVGSSNLVEEAAKSALVHSAPKFLRAAIRASLDRKTLAPPSFHFGRRAFHKSLGPSVIEQDHSTLS